MSRVFFLPCFIEMCKRRTAHLWRWSTTNTSTLKPSSGCWRYWSANATPQSSFRGADTESGREPDFLPHNKKYQPLQRPSIHPSNCWKHICTKLVTLFPGSLRPICVAYLAEGQLQVKIWRPCLRYTRLVLAHCPSYCGGGAGYPVPSSLSHGAPPLLGSTWNTNQATWHSLDSSDLK